MSTFNLPANTEYFYLNNNGDIGLEIQRITDTNDSPTYIDTHRTIVTPQFTPAFATTSQIFLLYADGNVEQYTADTPNGSLNLFFSDDTGPFVTFGPNNDFTVGELTGSAYVQFPSNNTHSQTFANGQLITDTYTGTDLKSQSVVLDFAYDPTRNLATLLRTINSTSLPILSAPGNANGLIGNDGSSLISHDGGSLISHDGGSLISHDGGSLISHDGGSLIGNDGSSVISNDGGSLISQDGGGLISQDGGGFNAKGQFIPGAAATQFIGGGGASAAFHVLADSTVHDPITSGLELVDNFDVFFTTPGQSRGNLDSIDPATATLHWIGGSGIWNGPLHWSPSEVPAATNDAFIDAAGTYTVTVNDAEDVKDLNIAGAAATLMDASGGILNVASDLTVSKGTFKLEQNGTVVGGVLTANGGKFAWLGGTLDGSTYIGNLDLSAAGSALHIANGLTVYASAGSVSPGTISITGAGSQLFFDGAQTFANADIKLGSAAKGAHTEYLWSTDPSGVGAQVLTLDSAVTVDQTGPKVEMDAGGQSGDGFDVYGTINATRAASTFTVKASSFTDDGTINVANGDVFSLTGTSITNNSNFNVSAGGQATITANNFTNDAPGTLSVTGANSTLTINAGWTNAGVIQIANGGAFHSDGTVTTADLGNIENADNSSGGTVFIDGTLDNTAATLDLSAHNIGKVFLGSTTPSTGRILNGTIFDPTSNLSFKDGTLDGVTFESALHLSGAQASLTVVNGITTNIGGAGNGEIDVNGAFSTLEFDGAQTIDNVAINLGAIGSAAQVNLNVQDFSFGAANITFGSNATINQTGLTVLMESFSGAGIVLNGTLNADYASGFYGIETNSVTNTGTMNVGNGDFLSIDDLNGSPQSTFTNNGTIAIDGGRMRIASKNFLGTGSVTVTGDGVLFLGGPTAQAVTFVTTGGELALEKPTAFTGTIGGMATGDSLDLEGIGLAKSATYDGKTLTVTENNNTTLQLTVSGLAAGNKFTIANDSSGTGTLLTPISQDVTWKAGVAGDFATAANWLPAPGAVPGTADNALITPSGTYVVTSSASGSVFTLGTASGAMLDITDASTFTLLSGTGTGTRALAGKVKIEDGSTLFAGGSINNKGIIDLHSSSTDTFLKVQGNISLSGTGDITLDEAHSRIVSDGSPATLTNSTNFISGIGIIGDATLSLINNATIEATGSDALVIQAGRGVTNTGSLLGFGTGGLKITNTTVTNTATGKLSAFGGGGSHIDLNNATIVGGLLSGPVNTIGAGNVLDGSTKQGTVALAVSNLGPVTINDNSSLVLAGMIKNSGTFALGSTGDHTELAIKGNVVLGGTGQVTMTDSGRNVIDSNGSAATLTNSNAISGAGIIGDGFMQVINKGTIMATGATNALVLTGLGFTNSGMLDANFGNLEILNTIIDNSSATASTDPLTSHAIGDGPAAGPSPTGPGVVLLNNATIRAGNLLGSIATTTGETSTLIGTAVDPLTNKATVHVADTSMLELVGTIKNPGAINLESTGADHTTLAISGNVTLTGAGSVAFLNHGNNFILNTNGNATLVNKGNAIDGDGVIGNANGTSTLTVNNMAGDITATGGVMILAPAAISNSAVIAASGSNATLDIANTTITNGSGGVISAKKAGSLVELSNTVIIGKGKVSTIDAQSTLEAFNNTTSFIVGPAVSNAGTMEAYNGNLLISGNVTNTGTLEASSVQTPSDLTQSDGQLVIAGKVTGSGNAIIDGNGEIVFGSSSDSNVAFNPNASGTGILRLDAATASSGENYSGTITGFGLSNAPKAVIDLVDLAFANVQPITAASYKPGAGDTGGVLTLKSGISSVMLKFSGMYNFKNFNVQNDGHGGTELTDPPTASPPQTAGGAGPANLALLGNYMASTFANAGGGHGGMLIADQLPAANLQPLLSPPHA